MSPLCFFIVRRFGGRVAITTGAGVCVLGFLATSFAPNIYLVCFTYGWVLASGACLIYMAGFLTVPLYFDKHHDFVVGMVSAGPGAGFVIMSPISQSLLEHFGWRKAMMILGGMNAVCCFLGCAITRNRNWRRVGPAPESTSVKRKLLGILSSMKNNVFKDHMLCLVFVIIVFLCLADFMPTVHLVSLFYIYYLSSCINS